MIDTHGTYWTFKLNFNYTNVYLAKILRDGHTKSR